MFKLGPGWNEEISGDVSSLLEAIVQKSQGKCSQAGFWNIKSNVVKIMLNNWKALHKSTQWGNQLEPCRPAEEIGF